MPEPMEQAIDDDVLAETLLFSLREHASPDHLREWLREDGPDMSLGSPQRVAFDAIVADLMAVPPPGHRVVREDEWTALRDRAERLRCALRLSGVTSDALHPGDLADDLREEADDDA